MKMKVAAVIPNWNGADYLPAAIDSLQAQSYPVEIIVVDNGSVDNSIELLEEDYPSVTLIKLPVNKGFSGGVNVGIKHAIENNFDAVALLNNDATVTEQWANALVSVLLKDNEASIATGLFVRDDNKHLDSSGDQLSVVGMPFPRDRNKQFNQSEYHKEYVFGATGGASLYRASALKEVGLFDEKFFAYYEDVDISFRMQLAGWKVVFEPKAIAYHKVSATSSKLGNFSRYHSTKNFFMLYLKNMPGILYWKYLPMHVLYGLRLFAGSIYRGYLPTFIKGYLAFLLLLPHSVIQRIKIQSKRKASIKYIDSLIYKNRPPKIPSI